MGFIAGAAMGGRLAASLDMVGLILDAGPIVKLVLLLLAAFSIISWGIIALKWREFARCEQDSEAFLEIYHDEGFAAAFEAAAQLDRSPLAEIFIAGCEEIQRRSGAKGKVSASNLDADGRRAVVKKLSWAAERERRSLERGLYFLATTGSSTPFIGLFGTVIGIVTSFQGIAAAGSASLSVVAPGIAEALIATAFGLMAAIPATIFYNIFSGKMDHQVGAIELFRGEFETDLAHLAETGAPAVLHAARSGS